MPTQIKPTSAKVFINEIKPLFGVTNGVQYQDIMNVSTLLGVSLPEYSVISSPNNTLKIYCLKDD